MNDFALAFDFDGVICNSVDECHITTLNAYNKMNAIPKRYRSLNELDPAKIDRFRAIRYFARNALEFLVIIYLCYEHEGEVTQADYDQLVNDHAEDLVEFERCFFEERDRLRSLDLTAWLNMNNCYPEFLDGWEQVVDHPHRYIITTKDLKSIQAFNDHWGLDFKAENIWTKELGMDKNLAIKTLAATGDVPLEQFMFIDDNIHHVRHVAETGVRSHLAAWGYTSGVTEESLAGTGIKIIHRLADALEG